MSAAANTDKPTMRVTNIALDYNEMPREITVVMSAPVADRFRSDGVEFRVAHDNPVTVPIDIAARVARRYGAAVPSDDVTSEIYYCLVNVFNRFWDGGLDEYEAGR